MSLDLAALAFNVVGLEAGPKAVLMALAFFADDKGGQLLPGSSKAGCAYRLRAALNRTVHDRPGRPGIHGRRRRHRKDGARTSRTATRLTGRCWWLMPTKTKVPSWHLGDNMTQLTKCQIRQA